MRRAEKAARIQRVLNELFPAPEIPLRHRDPYTSLVAVVLSAQTTDKKVNEVTPALFERAPTPEALRRLTVAQIQEMIRTVGLAPQKAKALRVLGAPELLEDFSQAGHHQGVLFGARARHGELPGGGLEVAGRSGHLPPDEVLVGIG